MSECVVFSLLVLYCNEFGSGYACLVGWLILILILILMIMEMLATIYDDDDGIGFRLWYLLV